VGQDLATLRRALRERFPDAAPGPCLPPSATLAPPGALCDLVGGPASGKCSLALRLLRETDGTIAWIDVAHELYPPAAAQAGIDLARLILCRPGDEIAALRAAERLLGCGWVRALALDRGARPEALAPAACHRLRRAAREGNVRLIVLGAVACGAADARYHVEREADGVRLLGNGPGARLHVSL
jgi:protein ImuA